MGGFSPLKGARLALREHDALLGAEAVDGAAQRGRLKLDDDADGRLDPATFG